MRVCSFILDSGNISTGPYLCLFVVLLGVTDTLGFYTRAVPPGWDYLLFSQIWPPTFCKTQKCVYPSNYTVWNIHGLWPSVVHGKNPEFCKSSHPFDIDRLQPIYNDLQLHWMNLKNYMKPKSFWVHEWDAHGRCAVSDFLLERELDYFNASLVLKDAIALRRRLDEFGIQPKKNNSIEVSTLLNALRTIYGVNGLITCRLHNGEFHLYEIRLCLNSELVLIDCPKKHNHRVEVELVSDGAPSVVLGEPPEEDKRRQQQLLSEDTYLGGDAMECSGTHVVYAPLDS